MGTGRRVATWRSAKLFVAAATLGALVAACGSSSTPGSKKSGSRVLLVGTYHGVKGQYSTIQAAVDAARPGDWILVAPGDYHETADHTHHLSASELALGGVGGVIVTTKDIHIRGMNRTGVIVDGTRSGAPKACDSSPAWQDFGLTSGNAGGQAGKAYGRNGIVVFEANGVTIDNLTVCNFLNGAGAAGNAIWWNGGNGTGKIGLTGYGGAYLTVTSTYFGTEKTAASYGIFSVDAAGPAKWEQIYANNFNDSGAYVGACARVCDITIDHVWMQYNALGYSGSNSGGAIVIENSEFDHNQDGLDSNTTVSGDPPVGQDGACPGGGVSPITHTHSCWVFIHNYVHDNNNSSSPSAGSAAQGPYGTGMTISGGRNATVMDNRFVNNGAWGVLFVPYPDSGKPVAGQTCKGAGGVINSIFGCVFDPEGDALIGNTFVHNGYFRNPTNGDYGQVVISGGQPQNCFAHNIAPDGSTPSNLQKVQTVCGVLTKSANTGGALLLQVACDAGVFKCPAGAHYPHAGTVVMRPLPAGLPTMPDPCAGVPANPWCRSG